MSSRTTRDPRPTQGLLAAVASPRRQEILRLLRERELSAGEIRAAMPDVTFGAVSQQLRILRESGLIAVRGDRQRRLYRACPEALAPVLEALEQMWNDALWRLKLAAELEHARRGPRESKRRKKGG